MQELTPAVSLELREAIALASRGDRTGARARAETAVERLGNHVALHAFLGMICCQTGDFAAGIKHLRAALAASPEDPTIATNLTAALIETGAFEEAAEVCSEQRAAQDGSLRLWRMRGFVLQQLGDHPAAAAVYERLVARNPDDWEAWNNLGNARSAIGQVAEAIAALERAARLCPDSGPIQLNFAASLTEAERLEEAEAVLRTFSARHPDDPKPLIDLAALLRFRYRDSEALEVLERAAPLTPGDARVWIDLGEQRMAAMAFDGAEAAFRNALAIAPADADANIRLAMLLENVNRESELPAVLEAAERAGIDRGAAQLIRALVCRRDRDFEGGLAALAEVPADLKPIVREQLHGQFLDRLGDADGAFAAFSEMNRQFKLDPSEPERRAEAHRAALRKERDLVTPDWYAGWDTVAVPDSPASPVFLVGFPRSGTTLLDTMLMGHPDAQVMEERPPLRQIELKLGGIDRLPRLDADAIAGLRDDYFAAAAEHVDPRPGALLIDKSPLHMNKVPLVHRLFPDARFILALRHPCDAVLSCFITAFRLNDAMANFVDLGTAAGYYDLSFSHWTNCTSVMPVPVHAIRYEDVVQDAETELRGLLGFLGLEWRDSVMDHTRTARSRGLISTASYAQVTEGLYTRAAGRWERYRSHLEPVLPTLAPWADRFGYRI